MRRLAFLALALCAAPASAYVRSTTGVDADGSSHPDQGLCTWWNTRELHYVVNASVLDGTTSSGTPLSGCGSAGAASALVQASFPAWQQSCTDMRFVFDRDDPADTGLGYDESGSNTNLVVWRQGSCSAFSDADCHVALKEMGPCIARHNCWAYGDSGILALTHTTFRPSTGEIVDADMELHAWDGVDPNITRGWWYTCASPDPGITTCTRPYGQGDCIYIDVGNTVTHEAGHVLGLDHTCVTSYPEPYNQCSAALVDGVMYPSAPFGETKKRALSDDDVSAVCTIYPAGRAVDRVTACPNSPSPEAGGCGCSTASPGALAPFGLLAVALGIWRRRARQRTIAPA